MPFHVSESFLQAVHKPAGLVLAYDFEEQPILSNTIDATKIKDLSGNGNHGDIVGSVPSVTGKFGKARDFPGTLTNRITAPDDPTLDGFTAGITMAALVKADTFPATNPRIFSKREGADQDYEFYVLGASDELRAFLKFPDLSVLDVGSTFTFPTGQFVTAVFRWRSSDGFYSFDVDGTTTASATASATAGKSIKSSTHRLHLGAIADSSDPWDGPFDWAFLYNLFLSDADVARLFENGGPFIIPGHKVRRLTLKEADEDLLDEMDLVVQNDGGEFRDHLGLGKEVKWYARMEGDAEALLRWTGIVKKPLQENPGDAPQTLATKAGDFVYEILTQRQVFETFINKDAGLALREAVESKCPELDTSLIQTGAPAVHVTSDGDRLKDLAFLFARMAGYQVRGDELKRVGFLPSGSDDSGLTADYAKVAEVRVGPDDTKLANVIRVDGGEGTGLIEERTAQTAFANVSDTVRELEKILTPKRKVKQVQVHTDPTRTGSGDSLIVRIQADDGTGLAPIAVGDPTQDLARKELPATFLAVNGLTTFLMPDHILGAGNEYWLIVESGPGGGQDVGVDGAGDITFRADFAFPIIEQVESASSIAKFGRREDQVPDASIVTKEEAKDRARLEIARRSVAERVARFEVRDPTLLTARPGQGVLLDLADEGVAVEKFILHERRWTLRRAVAVVRWSLVEEERLLDAADVIKVILERLQRVERRQLQATGEQVPDIFLFETDSYDYADAATMTVDTVLGMVWDADRWDFEVWSD